MRRNKADGVLLTRPSGVKNVDYGLKVEQKQNFQVVFQISKGLY